MNKGEAGCREKCVAVVSATYVFPSPRDDETQAAAENNRHISTDSRPRFFKTASRA